MTSGDNKNPQLWRFLTLYLRRDVKNSGADVESHSQGAPAQLPSRSAAYRAALPRLAGSGDAAAAFLRQISAHCVVKYGHKASDLVRLSCAECASVAARVETCLGGACSIRGLRSRQDSLSGLLFALPTVAWRHRRLLLRDHMGGSSGAGGRAAAAAIVALSCSASRRPVLGADASGSGPGARRGGDGARCEASTGLMVIVARQATRARGWAGAAVRLESVSSCHS